GANKLDRVRETFSLLLKVCMTYSVLLWLAIMLFPDLFGSLFSGDPILIEYAARALRIYCAGMFLFGIQIACQLTFTSIGNAPCSIIVAVVRKFVLLIPLIYIVPGIGILENKALDVYLAEPIADVIAVTFTGILFRFQFRRALAGETTPA
ncbi:MAG: MATE family efflux transporter, partial [Oscillospiraceae bacterium]|nr:MATE family efflux transporter [Oscillospiraceae bacterium]